MSGNGARIIGAFSGIVGLGLLFSSIVFLIQVVGYQNPGLLYDGYPPYRGTDYNSVSYNLFGYQFDPIIAIASVGVAIGAIQFLGSFALCCASRHKGISVGWMLLHILLLIGVVVCFALGFYYEVYLYLYPANAAYYDANYGFIGPNGNARLNGYSGYNGLYGFNNGVNNYNVAYNSLLRGLFGAPGYYNHTGQAYLAFLGIDMVFLLVGIGIVGCLMRREKYTDRYESSGTLYKNTSPVTTRM